MTTLPASVQANVDQATILPAMAPANGAVAAEDTVEYWKNRLIGFKQSHDTKVSGLNAQVSNLQNEVTQLKRENEDLRTENSRAQAPPNPLDSLTPDERMAIGNESLTAMDRVFKAASEQHAKTQQELADMRQKEKKSSDQSMQRFLSGLETLVPNYQAINGSPQFHAYLAQRDQFTGAEKQESLDAAIQSGDYRMAAEIFQGYLSLAQNAQAPAQQQPYMAGDVLPATPRSPGGEYVQQGGQVEIWNEREIDQFWKDQTAFMTKPGPKDPERLKYFQETERRIVQARAEGRVEP